MAPFQVMTTQDGSRCVLAVSGEVDLACAPDLVAAGTAHLDDAATTTLEVDLAGVTFMDSTALGALVSLRNAALERGKQISLTQVPDRVHKLLAITALTDVFGLDPT